MFNTFPFNKIAFNKRVAADLAACIPPHNILEASYEVEMPEVNRSFVVGVDISGGDVNGSAITQADVDLVGERLEVQHQPAATTAIAAAGVASMVLAKNRLDEKKGSITIPPHCGLELWDIVSVVDEAANQSGNYRVKRYVLELNSRKTAFLHLLELSAL